MPAMSAFGRRWHIGSDDLPLPMISLMTVHTVWCVVVLIAYIGTMLQTGERALVPRLLLAHLGCTCVDIAVSILGIVLGARSALFDPSRVSCMAGDHARNAVLVVVIGNWVVLLCTGLVVQSVFNVFSGVEVEESWRRRLALLGGCLRFLGVAGLVSADTDPMADAARAFGRVFRHIDFVPSDFATALVLVGISHADESRRREEAEWAALQAGGSVGGAAAAGDASLAAEYARVPASASSVASFGEGDGSDAGSDAGSGRDSAGGFRSPTPTRGGSAPLLKPGHLAARQLARGRDPELDAVVAEATHFSAFALAPYGWPLYVWAHPRCGACDLCCAIGVRPRRDELAHRRRACWRRCAPFGPHGPQDAADVAALVRFADIDEEDLLHMSFANSVLGALPYFIARDKRTRSVVLSVRGTLSVADCITDLLYEPAGLDGTVLGVGGAAGVPAGSCAHSGVLGCARVLHADLLQHRVLHEALEQPGWTLTITGHSLGAGVATLLGLMLRSEYPSLRVWAFSPPGGLLSEALAEASAGWCTSVVLGNDFICRLSMPNLERLRDEMMACAARAKSPKFTILRRAAVSGPQLRGSDVMYPPAQYGGGAAAVGGEVAEAMRKYAASVAGARKEATAPAVQLYPPGRLLHLVRLGRLRAATGGAAVYLPRWTTRAQLMSRIVVARNMFTNHLPDTMARELTRLADAIGVPSLEEIAARRAAAATEAARAEREASPMRR